MCHLFLVVPVPDTSPHTKLSVDTLYHALAETPNEDSQKSTLFRQCADTSKNIICNHQRIRSHTHA